MVDSARGSRVAASTRRTCTRPTTGAFTGEVSAPMLSEIDVDGVLLGHSERRELFDETDRALQHKVLGAGTGLVPMLCVGETEEERERGDTERKLRHQVMEDAREGRPDRLREVIDRLRADLGDRHGPGRHARSGPGGVRVRARARRALRRGRAEQVRVLYGGSVKPDNAAELMAQPDIDGSSSAAPVARGRVVRGDRRGRAAPLTGPRPSRSCPRRLGACPGRARATPSRSPTRRCSTGCGRATAHAAHPRSGQGRRAAARADGQLRGRAPQPRRGRDRQQDLARIDDAVEDGSLAETRRSGARWRARRACT